MFLFVLAFLLGAAHPALSQGKGMGPGGPGGPGGPMDEQTREKLERRVEQMIVWELSEVMALSEAKDEKFFTIMREHFRQKRDLTEKQFQAMESLRKVYEKKDATDAEIRKTLDVVEAQYDKQLKLEQDLHKNLKKVLTAREQARFIMEWPRVQNKVRDTIMQRKMEMQDGANQRRQGMKQKK